MRFRLTFGPTADASFGRLPRWARDRFDRGFESLEAEPRQVAGDLDVHQLHGYQNVWTWTVPPYRAVYVIDGDEIVLIVFGHRNVVYQDLHGLLPPRRQQVSAARVTRRR